MFLRSSTIVEQSFENASGLRTIFIQQSNVSTIRPGAFDGLPLLQNLYLNDNRISRLEPNTFEGLNSLNFLILDKNAISSISRHAFRGLPSLSLLSLTKNRLRSVPVDALLQPRALLRANLGTNRITTVDSRFALLTRNPRLSLDLDDNKLHCDANLHWFVRSLPTLGFIDSPSSLKCASPAELHGTLLHTLRENFSNAFNTTTVQPGTCLGQCEEISNTTATPYTNSVVPHTTFKDLYTEHTWPEKHGSTEIPASTNTNDVTSVTETNYIIILGDNPNANKDETFTRLFSIAPAVIVPLLFVLALAVVIFFYKGSHGTGLACHIVPTETEEEEEEPKPSETDECIIQPYAVVYFDADQLQESQEGVQSSTAHNKTSAENDAIQPNASTHDIDPGPQLRPYAITYDSDEDPGS
ncbi:PREDICTED: SLIT and NTRK-like protein 2 [Branchiostoma belcheri]|uniref:SLIT and NTRK-like protein 2 n=1 Tax=Branchiostoma belcheri TaxID=7741 RepID=A0A6P4YU70_BRABE|nr:PREDICTED: SLIT and NTRK-like protein 2 [Branchiostoma belcheri]